LPDLRRGADGLRLVAVESQGPAVVGSVLLDPEDPPALVVQHTLGDEVVDGLAWLIVGVQLQPRVGPQDTVVDGFVHRVRDALVADVHEAARELRVVADQPSMQSEDVHYVSPLPA
jgi:hypothetical protein